jgi:alpha-1,6-mannosyltransferase
VVDLLRSDPAAIGRAARAHVEANFSWKRTFDRLLGDIYPKAMARAAARGQSDKIRRFASEHQLQPAE